MSRHIYYPYDIANDSPIPHLYRQIATRLDSDSYEVTVLSSESGPIIGRDSVHERPVPRPHTNRKWLKAAGESFRKYDIVHTGGGPQPHYYMATIAHARSSDLAHLHSFRVDVDESGEYKTKYKRKLAAQATGLTAVSEHTARTVERAFGQLPEVIYNGVDPSLFTPEYDRPDLFDEIGVDGPVVLFVGRLEDRKRPQDILKVASVVPEATFVIVGDGPLSDDLSARAQTQQNVVLTGRLPKHRLPAIYANATLFLFPSVREGCPNVVLEAMAAGLPVVGYDATSMPELVTHGETGFLAELKDTDELATYVNELLQSEDAPKPGRQAREYILTNHTFDIIARQYERMYDRMV